MRVNISATQSESGSAYRRDSAGGGRGGRRKEGDGGRGRSWGQWSTLNAVFGTEVSGFAQFSPAAVNASVGDGGAWPLLFSLRVRLVGGNAVVHVAVGHLPVGAAAQIVEIDRDVAVHHRFQATAVVVVLTPLVPDEEDDDDEDQQDNEGGQGPDDDADVVVAVFLVLLLLVHDASAPSVCRDDSEMRIKT